MNIVKALAIEIGDVLRRSQCVKLRGEHIDKIAHLLHCALVGVDFIACKVEVFKEKFLCWVVGE